MNPTASRDLFKPLPALREPVSGPKSKKKQKIGPQQLHPPLTPIGSGRDLHTVTVVLQLPEMPEEDMPLFETLYSNEKEGTVYITPNGSLKVCNTEGYKTIKDKELNNRQKLWPIQKNRW